MSHKHKAIIIGSGIGGLICGIELARNNYAVTILEKNNIPGGYCSSFKKQGYTFDIGPHFLTAVGAKNNPIGLYLKKLPFKTNFIKLNNFDNFFLKKLKIKHPLNLNSLITSLQRKYPKEKNSITNFFNDIKNILYYYNNCNIPNIASLTFAKMLNNYFKNKNLKLELAAFSNYLGLSASKASALNISTLIASIFYYQSFYPQNGMSELPQILVKNLKHYGGEIIYQANVTAINTRANKIIGVTYNLPNKKNNQLNAKVIISNISPKYTFEKLLNSKLLPKNYLQKIKKTPSSISGCALYLGVNSDISKGKTGLYINKNKYIVTIPTINSKKIAPKNKSIIRIIGFLPANNTSKLTCQEKNKLKDFYLKKALELFPSIKNKIEVAVFFDPLSYLKLTNNTAGAFFGATVYPKISGKNSLANETPLNGLYLCGHWTNPMPAVQGVFISGLLTAKKVVANN